MDLKPASATDRCRKCGTPLVREDHIGLTIETPQIVERYDAAGHLRPELLHNVSERHIPCPNCGEARPLINPAVRRGRIIFLAAFALIVVGLLSLMLFL